VMAKCVWKASAVDMGEVLDVEAEEVGVSSSSSSEEDSSASSSNGADVDVEVEVSAVRPSETSSAAVGEVARFLSLFFLPFFSADPDPDPDVEPEADPTSPDLIVLPLGPITPPKMTPFFFFFGGSPSVPLELLEPALLVDVVVVVVMAGCCGVRLVSRDKVGELR